MRILLTGGCGFIGSAVIRHVLRHTAHEIVNVDKMTYAASLDALEEANGHPRHRLVRADIADAEAMRRVFAEAQPDAVMHLAAESHVDRSIDGPGDFIRTNVVGSFTLLEAARAYWSPARRRGAARFRFHHVSTDEVFGALQDGDPPFTEATPYDPRSPYSASKAASDHLARAWMHTYGLPVVVSNTTNNYGPWQFPEKLIPLIMLNALAGEPLPVYGDGCNKRDWLYVDDHAEALLRRARTRRAGRRPTPSARASRAATSTWCRRSAPCWTMRGARSGRRARAADHLRDRPARPRFPLRDRCELRRSGARLAGRA